MPRFLLSTHFISCHILSVQAFYFMPRFWVCDTLGRNARAFRLGYASAFFHAASDWFVRSNAFCFMRQRVWDPCAFRVDAFCFMQRLVGL